MRFRIEGKEADPVSNEVKVPVGASVDFLCTFRDRTMKHHVLSPFITFHYVERDGRIKTIDENSKASTKVLWDSFVTKKKLDQGYLEGTRVLHIRNITKLFSRTYICEATLFKTSCTVFTPLKVTVV